MLAMGVESGELSPKTGGFSLNVPSFLDLHRFVVDTASKTGDKTLRELREEMGEYLTGLISSEPGALLWKTQLDGELFDQIELSLRVGYSPKSGDWGEFVALLTLSNPALGWELAQKADAVARDLKENFGYGVELFLDKREEIILCASDKDSPEKVRADFGYENEINMLKWEDEADVSEHGNSPLIITPNYYSGSIPLDFPEFKRQISHFQHVVPNLIESIYKCMGLKCPNTAIELSVDEKGDSNN